MKSMLKNMLICTVTAAMICGCGTVSEEISTDTATETALETVTEVESTEATTETPQKVVALSKSVGEMWLLAGGELVGVTEDALELDGLSEDVVSIGSLSSPSEEAILALEPDLVLMTLDLSAHQQLKEDLEALGIAVTAVDIEGFQDYKDTMYAFTQLTGREDLYQTNCLDVETEIMSVLAAFDDSQTEGKTYLCMRVSATKNKVLKQDYFACEILDNFGLTNVAEDDSALSDLSMEAIAAADPDYIFVIYQGQESEAETIYEEVFTSQAAWANLKAVVNESVYVLPKDLFQYKPNARWGEAYEYIYEIL